MNYSTAIFLVNKDVRAVAVSYEVDSEGKGVRPFTKFKTFNPDVAPGQYVVIPTDTRHKMTVARVEEVDVEVPLDWHGDMQWLVGGVDPAGYHEILAQEAKAIDAIKSAQKKAAQEKLAAELMADNPDLALLSDITVDGAPALPAPSAA